MKKILTILTTVIMAMSLVSCDKDDPKTFTVTFNSDGGTEIVAQTVKDGERATRPTSPTKEDYNFLHWEQVAGTVFDFNTVIKADITLKASWSEIDICEVCGEEDCEKNHVKCEVCDEWDCEENHWTTSLGIASFATDSIWTITNGAITQVWSDAVQTIDCSNKTTFNGGGIFSSFNIDCRSNPGQKGDLFSWRAVTEVENICPQGWRVPTIQDFIDLDKAMGGSGEYRADDLDFINANYLDRWGGVYGGFSSMDLLYTQGISAIYWSQTESNAVGAYGFNFDTDGLINLSFVVGISKGIGSTLRCVRGN